MGTVSSESPKVQYSVQREQSDGSLNRISVRVPYFSKDDIHVYVDDVEINSSVSEQSTYTWRWDGDYIAITPNVASGSEVLVRRITPINEAIHIFDGRSEFDDQSMDENFQQLIYIAQEYSEGSGIKDVFSDINMHGYKIRNVGWATDDDDVVTYGQYKKDAEGAKVAMQKAETAAAKAEQHEQNTQAIANQAQTDITTSKESAITEITDRIAPEVDKARVHAVTAQSAAGTAVSASNRSETVLQHVQMLEDEAELHAGTAEAAKDEFLRIKDELKSDLDLQAQIAPAVKVVADNIEHVRTDSMNINDINTVAADLEGSFETGGVIDYGNLDIPNSGSAIITGGNIYVVAQNIDAVKKVAEGIGNLPSAGGLSNYYTKEETDAKIAEAVADIPAGGSNDAYDIVYGDTTVGAVLDDLLYVPISITSFTSNVGNQEKGSVVNDVTLSWNYNKVPQTLTLNGAPLDVATKSKALTGQNIKTNTTWTLKATDARGAISQKSVAISFLNGVYYGVGTVTDTAGVTNEFVQGLTKALASSRNRTFSTNAGKGQSIYYAIPAAMGTPTFYVGGFEGGFELLHTFLYTNSKGYSENYNVYKSINSSLGSTSVEVR